jgi:hypothetical protein
MQNASGGNIGGLTNRAMLNLPRTRFDAGVLVVRAASRAPLTGELE